MGRVAIVTGGTRGIGEAICLQLKDAGYAVAATYAGNDEAAAKFTEETGIATYGAEAGAQRYFGHSAARLSQSEAARMAAALPLPKQRPVVNPTGFTRRYANTISARMGVVRRDGLDSCVYD